MRSLRISSALSFIIYADSFNPDARTTFSDVILVKFGGSAITRKNLFETLDGEKLDMTSRHMQTASRIYKCKYAIVHGAGSFGHFQAKTYGLSSGGNTNDWIQGLCETRASVLKLNNIVINNQLRYNLPTVSVTLFPSTTTKAKHLAEIGSLSCVDKLLSADMWPVLHGDVLLDVLNRCSIYSGDKIMTWLAQHLRDENKPKLAVFLTDVQGVFTKPPSDPGAQLIPEILIQKDGSISFPETSVASHDVTGGIKGKIECAIEIANHDIPVVIVEAGTSHALTALSGKIPEVCTVIRKI